MTRMIAKAYRVADALRAAGIPVVMGGPHVTEVSRRSARPGRRTASRRRDRAGRGGRDVAADRRGRGARPAERSLRAGGRLRAGAQAEPRRIIPRFRGTSLDIDQFNRIPGFFRADHAALTAADWETFHIIPIESGRGCPYGCEFCTVTGFFGDSIRFRTNQSIVDEMLRLKARAQRTRGKIAVFFVDDNFAINVKRTKSLLRDIIAAGAQLSWVAQISANLLRDRGTARPDRGVRRQVDLHRHGVARPGQSGQRQQELQQAGGVRGGAASAGAAATSTRSRRSSSGWTTTRRASPSARWSRCATGRRCCRSSGRSRPSRRLRCTTACRRKDG